MGRIQDWLCRNFAAPFGQSKDQPQKQPIFKPGIDILLRVFAVLIGLSITDFLNTSRPPQSPLSDLWIYWSVFAALVSLLLRYFMGSAYHLEARYLIQPPGRGTSLLFFKDLIALIVFGIFAVFISLSSDLGVFMQRSIGLFGAAFVWALIDFLCHVALGVQSPTEHFLPGWAVINALQLLFTLLWYFLPLVGDRFAAVVLGLVYTLFFLVDFTLTLRAYERTNLPSLQSFQV